MGFAVGGGVAFVFGSELDANGDLRGVGGNGGEMGEAGEEKNAVGAGVGDVGEGLQQAAGVFERERGEGGAQVVAALVEDAVGDFMKAASAEFGDHAAGLEESGEFGFGGVEEGGGVDAEGGGEGVPAAVAGSVGGGVAAVPPDEKVVGVGGKGGLLRAVVLLEDGESFGEGWHDGGSV